LHAISLIKSSTILSNDVNTRQTHAILCVLHVFDLYSRYTAPPTPLKHQPVRPVDYRY